MSNLKEQAGSCSRQLFSSAESFGFIGWLGGVDPIYALLSDANDLVHLRCSSRALWSSLSFFNERPIQLGHKVRSIPEDVVERKHEPYQRTWMYKYVVAARRLYTTSEHLGVLHIPNFPYCLIPLQAPLLFEPIQKKTRPVQPVQPSRTLSPGPHRLGIGSPKKPIRPTTPGPCSDHNQQCSHTHRAPYLE